MTSEFGGASDFITSIGPDDSFVMLYSCPSCNTAPLRIKDWLYGRPSEYASKKQYQCTTAPTAQHDGSGEVAAPKGGSCCTTVKIKVVKLSSVVENLCRDNNVSLSKVLQAIGAIDKQTEEFCKVHLRWEKKICADPRLGDFP
eukprot:2959620-Amphidinium_carterae.1